MDSKRLQGYSDGVLGIAATLLVVPFMKLDETTKKELLVEKTLQEALFSAYRLRSFVLYYASFWIIVQLWIWQSKLFEGVKKVDGIMVAANWIALLGATLLPFTSGTAANAESNAGDDFKLVYKLEAPFYWNMMFISASHFCFSIWLLFRIREDLVKSNNLKKRLLVRLTESSLFSVFSVVALLMSFGMFGKVAASKAFIVYLILPPAIIFFKVCLRRTKYFTSCWPEEELTRALILQQTREIPSFFDTISNERMSTFTDGVVAICATLIVLDIQPQQSCAELIDLPSCLVHYSDGCRPVPNFDPFNFKFQCKFDYEESMAKSVYLIFSFIICFAIINILWTIHHAIFTTFQNEKKLSSISIFLNSHFCLFLTFLPFGMNLVTEYAIKPIASREFQNHKSQEIYSLDENAAKTACSFVTISLFLSSLCLVGLAAIHVPQNLNIFTRPIYLIKLLNIPFACVITLVLIYFDNHEGNSLAQRLAFLVPFTIMPLIHLLTIFFESFFPAHVKTGIDDEEEESAFLEFSPE